MCAMWVSLVLATVEAGSFYVKVCAAESDRLRPGNLTQA